MYIMLSKVLRHAPLPVDLSHLPSSPSHAQVSAAKSSLGLLTEAGFKHPGVKSFKLNPTLARYVQLKLDNTGL